MGDLWLGAACVRTHARKRQGSCAGEGPDFDPALPFKFTPMKGGKAPIKAPGAGVHNAVRHGVNDGGLDLRARVAASGRQRKPDRHHSLDNTIVY